MKGIKPFKLGLITRPFQFKREIHFGISVTAPSNCLAPCQSKKLSVWNMPPGADTVTPPGAIQVMPPTAVKLNPPVAVMS